MAKVPFSKLNIKTVNSEMKTVIINDQTIEVKQYLPAQDKLELISNVLNLSVAEGENYYNPVKLDMFTALQIVFFYTNLSFTDKQKEDIPKLYDLLDSNGVFNTIFEAIPEEEYDFIVNGVEEAADAIYEYHSSVLGILEAVSLNYDETTNDMKELNAELSNKDNLTLLKDVLTKLG